MPPFLPRKWQLSTPPPDTRTTKSGKKPTLFDTADKPAPSRSLQDNKTFLDSLDASESGSALSDVSGDEFEDALLAPRAKKRKLAHEEDVDEIDWEDAILADATPSTVAAAGPSGDLELTLGKAVPTSSLTNPHDKKKGPSRIERQIRIATHCMHVQFLLFHNLIRSGWACDKEVQVILVGQLPVGVKKEVDKWRAASGLGPDVSAAISNTPARKWRKGKKAAQSERNQRDWGRPAERQEKGVANMSRGDPLLRLLKVLAAYWRKRFTITAPCLRKQGYKTISNLEEEIASYRNEKHDREEHGERVSGIKEFRDLAKSCEGSRDIGAQLFTALIRGLGLEARLVASLQPAGFGWSKNEEAPGKETKYKTRLPVQSIPDETKESCVSEEDSQPDVQPQKTSTTPKPRAKGKIPRKPSGRKEGSIGAKDTPIDLSDDLDSGAAESDEDEASIVDVTPSTATKRPNANYDKDMASPTYWTEVISPITYQVYPVDPLILTPAVATSDELLSSFESRGAKADKAKQVFAYVVAYSPDGTAKDVTTRYLKRHMWPGRTKGVRMPIEKIPVYNKRGRIKQFEYYDWFKTVMSGYSRTDNMRTVVDELEDAKELKPIKPERKESKPAEDTLQGYKQSAEFVLERHLRREEALRPGSNPVKIFTIGKGDNIKEELVFRREDVEVCRTGESWHKEGRAINEGETPLKMVPIRAVTLTRKREVEEAERDSGEKLKQGLYSWEQTDWIIPPPIKNGIIPKNAFGNMDCYVPTMVPKGAVHIPLRSTVRICKRLGIDYAEAVTGFEFGNKRAVPVVTGVVVAEENAHTVIDIWEKEEEERRIKEEGKREKAALALWRKWLMGLRIIRRVREEYGRDANTYTKEEINPFTNQNKKKKGPATEVGKVSRQGEDIVSRPNEEIGGGFLGHEDFGDGCFPLEGHDEEVTHNKSELTIEDDTQPMRSDPKSSLQPRAQPRALVDTAMDGSSHGSQLSVLEDSDEQRVYSAPESRPVVNGKEARMSEPKPMKAIIPKKSSINSRKRKAPVPLDGSDVAEAVDTSKQSSETPARAEPKRHAARKRENVVKSHYFENESDDEEKGSSESSASEVMVQKITRKTKNGDEAVASTRGRPLRARKST